VAAASPPANVVRGFGGTQTPVCRGLGQFDRPWAGGWDGSVCNGDNSGNTMPATKNIQFLTLASGTVGWIPGASNRLNHVGPLPANTINAGKNYLNLDQILCSYAGYIGWGTQDACLAAGATQGGVGPYILTGTVR
jgi:hypothetical protein